MKTYKNLMNSLSDDDLLRQMTEEEIKELRSVFLQTYLDLADCCKRNGLTVMLLGGSCLGAVRHKGYIPWDDDLDVAMTRKDFERLKEIFDKEMGDKYILSSPNYKGNARNRFPMILVKDTVMVETGENPEEDLNKIKIDMFLLENIPENPVHRAIKGLWCTALMFITSYEETYEKCDEYMRRYMCKTPEGERIEMEKIDFMLDDGSSEAFYILDRAKLGGADYLLVSDLLPEEAEERAETEEEEGTVLILKDVADPDAKEAVYEIVEDDDELSAVCALLKETLEELGIET